MQSVDLNYDDGFQTTTQGTRPPQGIKVGSLNFRILMEPLGFLRLLEFLFAICAFATTVDFTTHLKLSGKCLNNNTEIDNASITVQYPFRLSRIDMMFCSKPLNIEGDFSSDAEFFVATGVLAFLYCIAIVAVYVLCQNMYENVNMVPLVDFIMTVIFAVFWLSGSAAWANGLNGLKSASDLPSYLAACAKITCTGFFGNYTKLTISVLLGFLNFFLWAGNLWFIYKETSWFQPPPPQGASNTI